MTLRHSYRTLPRLAGAAAFCLLVGLVCLQPASASAADIDREFTFELDKWYDLDVTDGPITVRRVRVEKLSAALKSKVFRATNTEFITDVQIQVEYVNDAPRDVEADLDIVWVDAEGREIDGYRGEEDMDENEHDEMTAAISTSKYGLERAKKLIVKIHF